MEYEDLPSEFRTQAGLTRGVLAVVETLITHLAAKGAISGPEFAQVLQDRAARHTKSQFDDVEEGQLAIVEILQFVALIAERC